MIAITLLLSEVGDKVPRIPVVFFWSVAIVVLAVTVIRVKKWLAIVPGILAGLFAVAVTAELRDPFVGPAVVRELGYSYAALCYFAAAIPVVMIVALLSRRKAKARPMKPPNAG